MTNSKTRIETDLIRSGNPIDPATGAIRAPIYNNVAFKFNDVNHAASLFDLNELGYIYSRITNPTVSALQQKMAELEQGTGAVCVASGHAANFVSLLPLMSPGKNLVASSRLYGGTTTLLTRSINSFGWTGKVADFTDLDSVKAAIDENTQLLLCESISNPGGVLVDIAAIVKIGESAGIPVIVDNTMATPYLYRPFDDGAALITHSLTKYISGHGTVLGGAVVEGGTFDWSKGGRFPMLSTPCGAYHDIVFTDNFKSQAFTFYSIAVSLRDFGCCLSAQSAGTISIGSESLAVRIDRHCSNALKLANFFEQHDAVVECDYLGLESSPYRDLVKRMLPRGASSTFTITLKGGFDQCIAVTNGLKIPILCANLGDARTTVIHSASTTHRQLSEEQLLSASLTPGMLRLSIGLENADDLIDDFTQAFANS